MEQDTNNQNNNNQQNQQQNKPQNQNVPQQNMAGEQNNRKVVTIAVVILVIIVLAALLASGRLGKKANAPKEETAATETKLPEGCKEGYKFSVVTGEPCPGNTGATATKPTGTKSDTLISGDDAGYNDILKQYTGRLALLDKECKPAIATQTFAPGTRFLIANDSATSHEVHFNGKAVVLSPYHYVTSSLKTEGKFNISCDGADVATITVETKK